MRIIKDKKAGSGARSMMHSNIKSVEQVIKKHCEGS